MLGGFQLEQRPALAPASVPPHGRDVLPATVNDAEVLAALVRAAFEEYESQLVPPSAALLETTESIGSQLVGGHGASLAVVDGRPVGGVLFEPRGSDLYFGRLSVLPDYRRMGIASALVASVEAEAARRACAGVLLSVRIALADNQAFFSSLGYLEVGREAHPGFGEPTYINMRKAL